MIIGVKKESLEGFLSSELSNKIDAFSHKAYKFAYSTEIDNAADLLHNADITLNCATTYFLINYCKCCKGCERVIK